MRFTVEGDADAETLTSLAGQSRARSAVDDVLTNSVAVSIHVVA